MQVATKNGVTFKIDRDQHILLRDLGFTYNAGMHYIRIYNAKTKERHLLHRYIMRAGSGDYIDHRNRNHLDNRRSNLRVCKHTENMRNRKLHSSSKSGYKGVRFDKQRNLWRASITVDGKTIWLGRFTTPQLAAQAYDKASRRFHGVYSSTNADLRIV